MEARTQKSGSMTVIGVEDGGEKMTILTDVDFDNWGGTVSNIPSITCIPTKVTEVQQIVKMAKQQGKRVRAAGFRHTWSNMYSDNGDMLVSLLSLEIATGSSAEVTADAIDGKPTDFNQIEIPKTFTAASDGDKMLVRVGAAVSNEAFRRWSLKSGWSLPINVIMVEITAGGANAPICHGAGITHDTLSDLVRQIEYVDANGDVQAISDPEKLKAAAGAFGLLGIVTHITLELDKMTYANLAPEKTAVGSAIPPPAGYKIPEGISYNLSEDQRQTAESAFIEKAKSFYSEWFWYPYNPRVWVNCWNNTPDKKGSVEYPSPAATLVQWLESSAADCINKEEWFTSQPGWKQGVFNGKFAMALMPPPFGLFHKTRKTALINGLHFRRGIQNFHVRCFELSIPIPASSTNPEEPDWSIVQRAWWDALTVTQEDKLQTGALRIVLELRIMRSSEIIMAPQGGNKWTACIEVISNFASGHDGSWKPFIQKLADAWTSYKTPDGKPLNVRPHWAKEWEDTTIGGMEMKQYLKEVAYDTQIPQFKEVLTTIGAAQGWGLDDLRKIFSNPLLDYLYFE
ncbi:FAD-binding domain-containing protein [Morchella conica CCBAS932]|uniref:FAD-binding domain-containing protein n=1 Tax=Morchella conica CCBAS932 TaxID=1392247 RepID=A0A3N4KD18_9PEZI|nr:FAD-binding domain-containing protein [Morchella conica CCBAS932]